MSSPKERFVFDCDHLLQFCDKFHKTKPEEQTEFVLEVKLKDLDARWGKVETSYEMVMLASDSVATPEFKQTSKVNFDACVEAYYLCTSQILDLMKADRMKTPLAQGYDASARYSIPAQTTAPSLPVQYHQSHVRVPVCDAPVFSGEYEDWPAFRDLFKAFYIDNPEIPPKLKLFILQSKTEKNASSLVRRVAFSDEGFDIAWKSLQERYENTRVLVDNQLELLHNIPSASSETPESLQRIQSGVNECLMSIRALGVRTDSWDALIVFTIVTKLPDQTHALWAQSLKSQRELCTWAQLDEFLSNRIEVVERIVAIRRAKGQYVSSNSPPAAIQSYTSQENLTRFLCKLCNDEHNIRVCPKFKKFSTQQRIDFVYKNSFCANCLSASHIKTNCSSTNTCFHCKQQHHTLLHKHLKPAQGNASEAQVNNAPLSQDSDSVNRDINDNVASTSSVRIHANIATGNTDILLRTALVQIEHMGELFTVRALIDPGSQRSFLSEKVRNRLNLPYRKASFEVAGIGDQIQNSDKECDLLVFSRKVSSRFEVTTIVLPKVTKRIPSVSFDIPNPSDLEELDLADPSFNRSAQIDLILGNDCERFINLEGIKKNICGLASAYNTVFGWVLSGPMEIPSVQSFSTSVTQLQNEDTNQILRKFWEVEEIPSDPIVSLDDQFCEEFYSQTTKRQADGRYMVRLPFKKEFPSTISLGPSRFVALSQYSRMEQSLQKNPELNIQYNNVLREYLDLNHMEETSSRESFLDNKCFSFYLPHHAVVRPESKSTKVRVVFNASRKTKSGYSLNDVLYTGPTLQSDLISIILNWRKYRFVFSGDIQKMYRQILVDPSDRPFQKILFQKSSQDPVQDFQLKTVTFGVNCAPFLAIRTLLQLATDSETQFPLAANILRNETYVDDILSGSHSIEKALEAQSQLIEVLKSAGFLLKKITSNDSRLLDPLSAEDLYDSDFLKFHESSSTKTLGIRWNAITDSFSYSFEPIQTSQQATKRQILSAIAKLFDPAGWLGPVIIRAKIIMQQLWLEGIGWDEMVGKESLQNWNNLVQDLVYVEMIRIPRWIQFSSSDALQIHGFCDASQQAYCAAIYIRSDIQNSQTSSHLLMAKNKVAPLQPVRLPRLELCGAVMLSKLVNYIAGSLRLENAEIILWTDASIVLGWLSKPPWTWETYVANRTSQIHQLVPSATWRHVPTSDNPADLGTRGCKPQELADNSLWWHGPSWLIESPSAWPAPPEEGLKITCLYSSEPEVDTLERFSSYPRALRTLSYVFRFIHNSLPKYRSQFQYSSLILTNSEIVFVKNRLIILSQKSNYSQEYDLVSMNSIVQNKSPLKPLNPFLDQNGILRVNGRLVDSSLTYNERFPIILPGNSRLCSLYLSYLHEVLIHGETNLMCRMVRMEFFVSRLRQRVKKVVHLCKTCTIFKRMTCSQIMAPLPADRCNFSLPFQITGVDFAGPFDLKSSSLRNAPYLKGYVSIFVCFSTKAVHLEPCSDLSTAAFSAAFARFVGRRGLPRKVVSDNGRNFLGASRRLLAEFSNFVRSASLEVAQKYSVHGLEWSFIPPHAPHMGGLWEAAVKSFKFHFKRLAGSQKFNFEEFSTVLARIEGVLNSRPLTAVSEDPSDLTALTPGHFLRGAPLMALPEPDFQNLPLINRWEKLKALHHKFSIRWKEDYVKSLHQRYKWQTPNPILQVNDLVVILDDLLPPNQWRLGRIEQLHLGSDNRPRVADVRTSTGSITRPIVKLCRLPCEKESLPTENNVTN